MTQTSSVLVGVLISSLVIACDTPAQEREAPLARSAPAPLYEAPRGEALQTANSRPVRTKVIPSPSPLLRQPIARPSGGGGSSSRGRQMTTAEAEEASRAIAETEPAGASPCARAWSVTRDMHRAYRQKSPRARRGGDRAAFMQGCRRMPRAMQECMNPQHYADNMESCDRVRRRLGRLMPSPDWDTSEPNSEESDSLYDEETDPYDDPQDDEFY